MLSEHRIFIIVFFPPSAKHRLHFLLNLSNLLIPIPNLSFSAKRHVYVTPRQVWMIFSRVSKTKQWGSKKWSAELLFLTAILSASWPLINSSAASPAESSSSLDDYNELALLKVHSSFRDNKNPGGLGCTCAHVHVVTPNLHTWEHFNKHI